MSEAVRAAGQDAWVAKNRSTLDEALGTIQKHLGRVEVIGDPEGADVAVNGRSVGKLPLAEPVRVSAGAVDIDVRAAGYSPAQRTVTLIGGQYQRVVIHLTKLNVESLPPPTADDVSGSQPDLGATATPAAPATGSPGEGPSATRVGLKWAAAGLAVAGLGTGIVGTALHSSNVSKFDDHPCFNSGGQGVLTDGTPDTTCQSLLDSFKNDEKIAIVGFVAAGVFGATWLALFLTEPSPEERPAAQASRWPICAPAPGSVGFSCVARF